MIGAVPFSITSPLIITSSTFVAVGISNMESHQDRSENGAETTRPCFTFNGLTGNRLKGIFPEVEFDIIHVEQRLVLLGQRIAGFRQDRTSASSSRSSRVANRQAADKFRISPNFSRSSGSTGQTLTCGHIVFGLNISTETDRRTFVAAGNHLVETRQKPRHR